MQNAVALPKTPSVPVTPLSETRVRAHATFRETHDWSAPTLTAVACQGYTSSCTTIASGYGRYTQADPIGFEGGDLNLYRYAGARPLNEIDFLGLSSGPPDNVIPFPGNPNNLPDPNRDPWSDCDDVRRFNPNRKPYTPVMDPKRIVRGAGRALVTFALAAVNVKVWACAIARNYCTAQSGLSYCECMQYADRSNNCSALPAGSSFNCPPQPPPPPPKPCCGK